ncbi:hypothetical protein BMW23_0837 [Bodo saltans virus]|uniref:Uncharacterized protein n=1 Tax=Bodo saltans virus TaxID=2024608 RepID=A0A2H4UVD0_9VIRU|nr:hypothetical protein QJ851_gp0820 [Bodo saltans virus]ATZ80883.1 hypothetical protein BMW23_0837 [Bodo saltans virus]
MYTEKLKIYFLYTLEILMNYRPYGDYFMIRSMYTEKLKIYFLYTLEILMHYRPYGFILNFIYMVIIS